jgi:amino acid transporter
VAVPQRVDSARTVTEPVDKGLRGSAIGLLASVVIGLAATAPAYSITATLGFVVIAVGLHAPAVLFLAFFPMMAIAVAFAQLNRDDPDCGTTFTWGTKTFGPWVGWLGGWGMTFAAVIAMAYLAGIAGQYFFLFFGADDLATSQGWVAVVGAAIVALMTVVCYRGIRISAKLQFVLFGIEAVMLLVFSIVALVKVYSGHAPSGSVHPTMTWLNPFQTGGFSAFTAGLLLALFIYWGWDSSVSINEETTDRHVNPGRAAVIATVALLVLYMLTATAAQAYGGGGTKGIGLANPDTATDVLATLGASALGSTLNKLLILATFSSAIGALQTGILPAARTTLAMSTYRALPAAFGRMSPRFQSPSVSTFFIGGSTAVLFVIGTFVAGGRVQWDSISAIGLLIAFYYGLVGFTSVWYFRHDLSRSTKDLLLKGIIPGAGALVLTLAFLKSAWEMRKADYGYTSFHGIGGVFLLGVGTLGVGAVVMLGYAAARPGFFRGEHGPGEVTPPERRTDVAAGQAASGTLG